jgi:signal peptidase I
MYSLLAVLFARRIIVRGTSMYPTLRSGERLLFDRLAYRLSGPRRGDIVLARHPARPGVRFIKRVVPPPERSGLPTGQFWLLGDNTDASTDSRQLGPFSRDDIIARGWLVYWPPERYRRLGP